MGKIPYKDGRIPAYERPYLITGVHRHCIEVLNVSSIKGKERKLAFHCNYRIVNYRPPFIKPSFVKLDSLVTVRENEWDDLKLLHKGEPLDINELKIIQKKIIRN